MKRLLNPRIHGFFLRIPRKRWTGHRKFVRTLLNFIDNRGFIQRRIALIITRDGYQDIREYSDR